MMEAEGEKINILMVDDSPTNLLALESILQAPDRKLVRAMSGEEALRYLLNYDFAVILLDVYMPGIDGLETAALIRGREKSRDIPIIFLTADSTGSRHIAHGYSLGAVDYILKPVEPDILRSKVAVFVELFKKTEEVKRQAELLHEKNIELENANLQRLGRLIDLGQRLASERDPARVLESFCREARDIVGANHAGIGVGDGTASRLLHFFHDEIEGPRDGSIILAPEVDEGMLGSVLRGRRAVRVSFADDSLDMDELPSSQRAARSFLGAPLSHAGHVFGWIYLTDKLDAEEFSEADERLAATLATQVAVAYESARLYTELQRHAAALQQEVAERKQAEEERARMLLREQAARAEAEQANRMKDEFLATLSHELRTPLTAILGWARLLRDGGVAFSEEHLERALETIERNARSQSQLIDDLLDVSRIITGKLRLEVAPIDLAAVVQSAFDSVRPAADAKKIGLEVSLVRDTVPVTGDATRLQQVLWNLLSNAVKFTPEGGHVETRLERTDTHAQITIRDTGTGIEPQFLPYIFERFRQADGSTTRKHGGLGLGLAIARHLVELHGGTINVNSAGENQGTTFTFTLPLRQFDVRPRTGNGSELTPEGAAPSPIPCAPNLEGLRILVVDDEDDTRQVISTVLKKCGAVVKDCGSAAEALEIIRAWVPDMLVSDIGMPHEDGYSLIKKVRENDWSQRLPAIALTAYANIEDRNRALSAGFQRHIAKPVEPDELISTVAGVAERAAQS